MLIRLLALGLAILVVYVAYNLACAAGVNIANALGLKRLANFFDTISL